MKAIIAGGGTGGHLFPGIAVARKICRRHPGSEVLFVGAERGVETRIVPQEGFRLRTLSLGGLKGMSLRLRTKNLAAALDGLLKARQILAEFKPDVVIGVGGYASFPMVGAAVLAGCARIIMEQNALPGLANRVLGRWVDFAAVSDPRTCSYFGDRAVVTGNPVRPEFKSIAPKQHAAPFTVLIFGGSQGAQSINLAVVDALQFLSDWKNRLHFVHQTGEKQVQDVRKAYSDRGFDADVSVFFDDFHQAYAAADLIVSRAGATTVAEIKAAGRAAILVPFPFAADDHQTKNALAMVEERAAVMLKNSDLNGKRLAETMTAMLSEPRRLEEIEANARRIAVVDAEERIVDLIEAAIEKRKRKAKAQP